MFLNGWMDRLDKFESVEDRLDRLEHVAELFEAETTDAKTELQKAKRDAHREVMREVRKVLRNAKADIAANEKELGKRLMAKPCGRRSPPRSRGSWRRGRRPIPSQTRRPA